MEGLTEPTPAKDDSNENGLAKRVRVFRRPGEATEAGRS